PPGEAKNAVKLEERGRNGRAEADRHRDRRHEGRDDARAMMRREPISEVEDHAGEEARLGKTQRKTQDKKANRPLGEGEATRDDAPADHDAGDPAACPDLFEDQIAWNLEQEVAPEKGAGAEPVDIAAQLQILVHRQSREPDVHAVEIANEVE